MPSSESEPLKYEAGMLPLKPGIPHFLMEDETKYRGFFFCNASKWIASFHSNQTYRSREICYSIYEYVFKPNCVPCVQQEDFPYERESQRGWICSPPFHVTFSGTLYSSCVKQYRTSCCMMKGWGDRRAGFREENHHYRIKGAKSFVAWLGNRVFATKVRPK
jgi:hypothetical protein